MSNTIIKLSDNREAEVKTSLTNRERLKLMSGDVEDKAAVFEAALKIILIKYEGLEGDAAVEALLDSDNGDDFATISEKVGEVLAGESSKK